MDGANIRNLSEENGYGNPDVQKAMSKSGGTYTVPPAKPMLVNDNFTEEKFAGTSSAPSKGEQSGSGKDAIQIG